MADGKLAFLGDEDVTDEAAAEVVETPSPDVAVEAVTGEETAPPAGVEQVSKDVPLLSLLDEREKRQAKEREAEEARRETADLRRKLQEMEASKAQPAPPDFYEDPDKRLGFEYSRFQKDMQAQTLRTSQFYAEREYGAAAVREAHAYFDQHPELSQQLLAHPSPFHAAVEFYRKQKVAEEIGTDPEAYKKKLMDELAPTLREQIMAEVRAELQGQPVQKAKLPGSLASAPSAGRQEPTSAAGAPGHLTALFG